MNPQFSPVLESDFDNLLALRIAAMRESLESVGRFDPEGMTERLRSHFVPEEFTKVVHDGLLVGFYAVCRESDHLFLGHLYVLPDFQNKGLGSLIIKDVIRRSEAEELPVRLRVLTSSPAKKFYLRYGFEVNSMDELDSYCERPVSS